MGTQEETTIDLVQTQVGIGTLEIRKAEMMEGTSLVIIRQLVITQTAASREKLDLADLDFKDLHSQLKAIRMGKVDVLEISTVPQNRTLWCTICPTALRREVIHTGL